MSELWVGVNVSVTQTPGTATFSNGSGITTSQSGGSVDSTLGSAISFENDGSAHVIDSTLQFNSDNSPYADALGDSNLHVASPVSTGGDSSIYSNPSAMGGEVNFGGVAIEAPTSTTITTSSGGSETEVVNYNDYVYHGELNGQAVVVADGGTPPADVYTEIPLNFDKVSNNGVVSYVNLGSQIFASLLYVDVGYVSSYGVGYYGGNYGYYGGGGYGYYGSYGYYGGYNYGYYGSVGYGYYVSNNYSYYGGGGYGYGNPYGGVGYGYYSGGQNSGSGGSYGSYFQFGSYSGGSTITG